MTEAMFMWVLIAIVQAHWPTVGAWGSQAACEEQKADFIKMPDVVFLSECVKVEILPKDKVAEKK